MALSDQLMDLANRTKRLEDTAAATRAQNREERPEVMVQATNLVTYFSSEVGRLRIAAPFLREGITLGQPCFLIASGSVLQRYVNALEKDVKSELAEARRSGLFATAPEPGRTVEQEMALWDVRIASAASRTDPHIVRIVADMACLRPTLPTMREMLIFERTVAAIVKRFPTFAICQYDVRELDGRSLLAVMKAHPDVNGVGFVKFVS